MVCFADNYWLFATSAVMLQAMTSTWLTLLDEAGLHTPLDELTWCTTARDECEFSVEVRGGDIRRASRKVGFKVPGTQQTFDNSCDVEIKSRIDKAWKAFHLHRDILCCKSASMGSRLRCLQMLVASTLMWGAGSWNVTKKQRSLLRGVQQRMMSKMLGFRRGPTESMAEYCARVNRCSARLLETHGLQKWDIQQMRSYYDFMGSLARMRRHDPERISHQILCYNDLDYIARLQAEFGNQTHGRRFHVWRLESALHKHARDWKRQAQSACEWNLDFSLRFV